MAHQRLDCLLVAFILVSGACSTPNLQGGPDSPQTQRAPQTGQPRVTPHQPADGGSPPTGPATGQAVGPADPGAPSDELEPPPAERFPSPLILSVLDFEDRAARVELRWLRRGLPEMLAAELSPHPDLIVIQRGRLDEVIREQSLQLSARIGDETSLRIGQLLGATVLVTGSLAVVKENLRLDAQLIEVGRGAVLGRTTAEGPIDHAPAVATELVQKVLRLLPGRPAPAPQPDHPRREPEGK